jgi:hypothetical protein
MTTYTAPTQTRPELATPSWETFDLDVLAHEIADQGIAANEAKVSAVAAAGRNRGCTEPLIAVLADRSQPAIARERAFGALVASWASSPGALRVC